MLFPWRQLGRASWPPVGACLPEREACPDAAAVHAACQEVNACVPGTGTGWGIGYAGLEDKGVSGMGDIVPAIVRAIPVSRLVKIVRLRISPDEQPAFEHKALDVIVAVAWI